LPEPLVSVVVPIYNVEAKLCRCIESIIKQTYSNLEIILVDDGSPDNCPQICDDYADKDQRIKVIHKINEGLGYARNTGIENATGKYICFFDSDDYVELTAIAETCSIAEELKADLVCFGHIEETENGRIIENRIPTTPKDLFYGDELKNKLIPLTLSHDPATGEDWNLSLSAWSAMFSMEVIRQNNWRFVSERECISEDIYSVLQYYGYSGRVAYIKKALYHYISNPLSLSKVYRKDRYERLKILSEKLFELTKKMNQEDMLHDRVKTIFLGLTIGAIKQITASDEPLKIKYNAVKEIVCDDYMQNTLSEYPFSGESVAKRLLFVCMKRKLCTMSYLIFKVKSWIESR